MNNITLQEYVFKEITIIFNSHKHIFRTSSLKMRACSSQPIRFWTNLKTCINTKKNVPVTGKERLLPREHVAVCLGVSLTSSTLHAATCLAWMPWTPGSSLQCCSQHRDRVRSDWVLSADRNSEGYMPSEDRSAERHTDNMLPISCW